MASLLCFLVNYVLTHERIIFLELKSLRRVNLIFHGHVHVRTLSASEGNYDAIFFFCHRIDLSTTVLMNKILVYVFCLLMEPATGIEPVTSPLPRECSTTELRGRLIAFLELTTGFEPVTC